MMHIIGSFRSLFLLLGLVCALAASPAFSNSRDDGDDDRGARHHGSERFRIEVLSGRADMVAGGDALIRVTVNKKGVTVNQARIMLNGADITPAFVASGAARTLTGLVTGMRL